MEDFIVQLRGLNEVTFCEKLFYLMYVKGIFYENADTIEGKMHHKKREQTKKNSTLDDVKVFDVILHGMGGKLTAKLDGVIQEENEVIPVEDKNSKQPESEIEGNLWGISVKSEAWINDLPQIIGQMYLLRKNGYKCKHGKIYYRGSNSMVDVPYLDEYDKLIENGVEHCIELTKKAEPEPLVDSDKCIRCSLNWACLPDETNMLNNKTNEARILYPGRHDESILYLTTVGSKLGKSGESLSVWTPQGETDTIPLKDIENVCVFGNVQVTTQAASAIIAQGGSIFYFTGGGWLSAITSAPVTKNIYLRIRQFDAFRDEKLRKYLTKKVVYAKISNQRTLLRRNKKTDIDDTLQAMQICRDKVAESYEIDTIRGYEGNAASAYWDAFTALFNNDNFKMNGRNRRPPKVEVNAMLSYGYSLLLRDVASACLESGLDHMMGFFHSIVPGRPALALDMMEPFRPIIVDSVILRIINENIVSKAGFAVTDAGVFMKPETKRAVIYMYEKRMDELVTHSKFEYRISYRRMLYLEMKLLGKFISGEIDDYTPLMTR